MKYRTDVDLHNLCRQEDHVCFSLVSICVLVSCAGVTWNEMEGVGEDLGTVIEEFPPLKIFFQP